MKLAGKRRSDVDAWTSGIRSRALARRANACISCGAIPIRARYEGDPERGPLGCYWCSRCKALAFGPDSFIGNLSRHELASLSPVGVDEGAAKAPSEKQGKLL
jgi:hypothetical protein